MAYFHTIASVRPLDGERLEVEFEPGGRRVIDLSAMVHAGGAFAPLASPTMFSQVQRDRRGRSLVWPNGVDLCADALWLATESGGKTQ